MDKTAIRDALDRVLGSPAFQKSARSTELLKYIIEEHLEGRAEQLLGTIIAQDVLGRDETFDSNTDPIVRVQMGRLRAMLAAYYHGDGAADPVLITIPKGRYAPKIETRTTPSEPQVAQISPPVTQFAATPDAPTDHPALGRLRRFGPLTVLALIAVVVILLISAAMTGRQTDPSLQMPSGPRVLVAQFSFAGDTELAEVIPVGFRVELIDRLSRFKNVFVYGPYTSFETLLSAASTIDDNAGRPEFILSGSIALAGDQLSVTSQLFDVSRAVVVWSDTYANIIASPSEINSVKAMIVSEVAATLGQPYGVIESYMKRNAADLEGLMFDDYICVLRFYDYARKKTAEDHATVRDCLEAATTKFPNYSDAWAALSWIYGDEARYGFNRRSNAEGPLERALNAAQTAVATDPYNSMAHEYLAVVFFMQGKKEGFQQSTARALDLNPNNSEALASAGQIMQIWGNSEDGLLMSEKALSLNPGHPPWFHIGPTIYHYRKGNSEEAYYHATAFTQDNSALSKILLIAASVRKGLNQEAGTRWINLTETYPEFASDPGAMLRIRQFSEPLIDMIETDLKAAQSFAPNL